MFMHILCWLVFQSGMIEVGLYRIYFFQSGRSRIWNDKSGQSRIFKLTNFTNLMCKTLRTYKWLEFLIIFCAAAVTATTFLISGFLTYLGLLA